MVWICRSGICRVPMVDRHCSGSMTMVALESMHFQRLTHGLSGVNVLCWWIFVDMAMRQEYARWDNTSGTMWIV